MAEKIQDLWHGRFDGTDARDLRLWQVIKEVKDIRDGGVCFIGYDTDDGVARNQGRTGASEGSNAIRKAMQSFPAINEISCYDYGNLHHKKLEMAQEEYSHKVTDVLKKKVFPIGLGGGHDIAFGSYCGVRNTYPDKKIGIINFDAHLDMRAYETGATSGTSFKQILDKDKNVRYAIVGFQAQGNTKRLREVACTYDTLIINEEESEEQTIHALKQYVTNVECIYISVCMDVFDAAFAPGVSSPTTMGFEPKKAKRIIRELLKTELVVCIDFAEVNPHYDTDNRTSALAASLIYSIISSENNFVGISL